MSTETAERVRDTMSFITDAACRVEQLKDSLGILSDGIHEIFDGNLGEVPKGIQAHLYRYWLLLQVIERDTEATKQLIDNAEVALLIEHRQP